MERMYPQIHIETANHDRDHIHLLLSIAPSMKVSDVVRVIKSFLSREITKKYDFLKYVYYGTDGIWSDGYFVSTIGLNEEQIRRYIEMQGLEDSGQTMELFD